MTAPLPLEGVRICDFTLVWAGQSAVMYLADLGAECIKIENPYVWPPSTRGTSPTITKEMVDAVPGWAGGFPGGDPGPRPWNNHPGFIYVLRNKKSVTVDGRRPEGLAVIKALISSSDVIAENISLGALDKLGLDDDAIRAARSDMIIMHMPGFGRTGDYREGRGFGSHIDAVGGSSVLRGYRDTSPSDNTALVIGDFFAGTHAAIALMAALRHRKRTGEGQIIEMAQRESSMQMIPQAILDTLWNGKVHGSIGNRSIEGFVPNGAFPCRGDDSWISISCRSDEEWAALVDFIGRPPWATRDGMDLAAERAAVEDMIEEQLAAWTSGRDRDELFHDLQAAGVTAGPILNSKDVTEDPQLEAMNAWQRLPATDDYPEVDWQRPPFRFSETDIKIRLAPAAFASHNDYVYREVLGFSDEEVAKFQAEGHIQDRYDRSILEPGG